MVLLITRFLPTIIHTHSSQKIAEDYELDSFRNSLEYYNVYKKQISTESHKLRPDYKLVPENFDPNTVTGEKLQKMGFPEKVTNNILKYRSSGGKFRRKEDLQKIYNLTPELYNKIEAYITIIVNEDKSKNHENKEIRKAIVEMIDINRTDSMELQKLYGIGPVLATRIIKYRDLLGGYIKKEQLLEVYGIDEVLFSSFRERINVDTSLVRKLNLNRADLKTLYRYPYLSPWQAKAIMEYKEVIGDFKDINEVEKNGLVPHEVFLKISPYLEL